MAASFPSASCPVGPQCLSQFLLDPQVWGWLDLLMQCVILTTWDKQADSKETFGCYSCCKACWRTHLSLLIFFSQSPKIMSLRRKAGACQPKHPKQNKSSTLRFLSLFLLQLCVHCNQFLPLMNWLSLHWRRFNSTIWVTEINCKTWQPEMLAATSPAFVWVKKPTCPPRNRLKW